MDFSYLISIGDGDQEFIARFLSTFQENTSKLLLEMENSLAQGNHDALRKAAHQLKPSLEMLKLTSHDLAVNIQHHPEAAKPADIQSIRLECENAASAIRERFGLA